MKKKMQSQVKEFINQLIKKIDLEKKPNKFTKKYKKTRTLGIFPDVDYNVPNINDFTHFMECEIAPNICPLSWESLEVDFENRNRRYCEYCAKYIYKADNEMMLQKLKDENKCMAISKQLFEKINGRIDEKRYENIQNRLIISKFFMFFKRYESNFYEKIQEENLSYERQLERMFLYVLNNNLIDNYINKGVEIDVIFIWILEYNSNKEFEKIIHDKINNKLKVKGF